MGDTALDALIEYLENTNTEIKRLEAEGDVVIQQGDQHGFQAKLEKKAELLADLGKKAADLTQAVGGQLEQDVDSRLEQFGASASTALRIGSVFFMTALLYPEDHKPGDPNDLEVLIGELRRQA